MFVFYVLLLFHSSSFSALWTSKHCSGQLEATLLLLGDLHTTSSGFQQHLMCTYYSVLQNLLWPCRSLHDLVEKD